jgi:signal transduction histidine kinase
MLRVSDQGLGIPAEAVPFVFDRHWRANGATHGIPGSGLGLYTCRAIIAAHGGYIWVERSVPAAASGTEAGWHGTVMALFLPLASSDSLPGAGVGRDADMSGAASGGS